MGIKREVKEETGLEIHWLEVIGISSNPEKESVEYPNGDQIQYFTVEFYSNDWEGELKPQDDAEVRSAKFVSVEAIQQWPGNEGSAFESLAYYQQIGNSHGQVIGRFRSKIESILRLQFSSQVLRPV